MSGNQTQAANKTTQQVSFSLSVTHDEIATFDTNANRTGFSCDTKVSGELNFPKQAKGFHGYYTLGATKWHVDSDGDIRDGELLVAEPSYLSRQGYKNAALIAAAPELLAALELAAELLAWELIYPNTNGAIRQSSPVNHKRLLETATAAIAKARGV